MALLKRISIANFKCYRKEISFDLNKSSFFIGANNSGKSAILKAIHCFFDDRQFNSEFINKTELRAKASGYNKSTIRIEFNLEELSTKSLKEKLIRAYPELQTITKTFTFREKSKTIQIEYLINEKTYDFDDLDESMVDFLSRINVSYIHPQESAELLIKAQEKLKLRLLSNWGRNASLAEIIKQLQTQWAELRNRANPYLSNGLTQSLQEIWPGCKTTVDLPLNIEDVIAISEISFAADNELPAVNLTSQGTGAQSAILYQTHYLLDSDRTLHRGFYYPIWLIEEPESFLHADIIFKLGNYLCSDEWLSNIQMLASTHSPLLLATSKQNSKLINWCFLKDNQIEKQDSVENWDQENIKKIGIVMGDPNFDIYFSTASRGNIIVLEDSREITFQKFRESGIDVTLRLKGVSDQRRYFDVLRAVDISLGRKIYFLVDNDDGIKDFKNVLEKEQILNTSEKGFIKYRFENNIYIILFPENYAAEELFDEHRSILESCANQIFNADFTHAATDSNIPPNLTRAHAHIRNKTVNGLEDAINLIRNQQDVKDTFWNEVTTKNLKMNEDLLSDLMQFIE
ncbi:MAG: AAA family ATPase [Bacteroidota bacterium]